MTFEPYRYERPTTVAEASRLLREEGAAALAGGTDLLLEMRLRHSRPGCVVDLKALRDLRGIRETADGIWIGALTTVTEIQESALLRERLTCLTDAADVFACHEIRNRATVGGNLANASPGAEFSVPLMALDAVVVAQGDAETRVPIGQFLRGPGRTDLGPGELITGVVLPDVGGDLRSAYRRRARTRGMDLAAVSLAVVVRSPATAARRTVALSMGAVAPVPPRPLAVEQMLSGVELTDELVADAGRALVADLRPRASSLRATPEAKRSVLPVMLRRALRDLEVTP